MSENQDLIQKAWKALRSPGGDPVELLALAKKLKGENRFGLARRLLERACDDRDRKIDSPQLSLLLRQQHALCTYKDPDLPRHLALDKAWSILDFEGDLDHTTNQETLGLAGAIYKRRWQIDANKSNLERSLAYYYERGHKTAARIRQDALEGKPLPDDDEVALEQVWEGYTSINAAFVLDLLASIEESEARETGSTSTFASERRAEARRVREELVRSLPALMEKGIAGKSWWRLATVLEAHFGLGDIAAARETLRKAKDDLEVESWMLESSARQLAKLAALRFPGGVPDQQDMEESEAWKLVRELCGGDEQAVRSLFSGKLGLALSGGGFRASLFHIGVLARLAEEDLLRHVHVLSCVSGGSILGAYYFLELKNLLEEKWDQPGQGREDDEVISRDDYVRLVARVAEQFLEGVQRNLRTRVAGSLVGNLRMAFQPSYSRTDRLGELLEKELFSRIGDDRGRRKRRSEKRYLDELRIVPREFQAQGDEPAKPFHPKVHNWRRRNKVPMLVLNATALNTGHNWQFTSTFMGESPFAIDPEVDGNWRLRRMWYREAPSVYQPPFEERPGGKRRIRLGKAVGASACVPGLFEPVALPELYPKEPIAGRFAEMTVRLVDGGVHDNQGVGSLLEQDCDVFVVSDASGQMTSSPDPGGGILKTVLRTNSVLMERVRQAQLQDLKARLRSGLLKGLMVVHLKKGLETDPIDWRECEEPPDVPMRERSELLRHGVLRRMQELLAGVRTDLDSFSEVEAYALMADGYLMASTYTSDLHTLPRRQVDPEQREPWPFLQLEEPLFTRGSSRRRQDAIGQQLAVASEKAFKIWKLSTLLRLLSKALAGAAAVAFLWLWLAKPEVVLLQIVPDSPQFGISITINTIGWAAVIAIATFLLTRILGDFFGKVAMKLLQWRETLTQLVKGAVLATFGFVVARIHLLFFDRWFLRRGKVDKL